MPQYLSLKLVSGLINIPSSVILNALLHAGYRTTGVRDVKVNIEDVNALIRARKIAYKFNAASSARKKNHAICLPPSKRTNITAIDLFSGAGGWSCGLEMAGLSVVGAIDHDRCASETHKVNFPSCETICSDITTFSPKDLEKRVGENIDVIVGSPPCQTFSTLGHGKMASLGIDLKGDIRNYYYKAYVDYVRHFRPKIFVMENVPGFATKHNGDIFKDFCGLLGGDKGYRLAHTIVKTEEYGIPQKRRRLIVVGFRIDLQIAKQKNPIEVLCPPENIRKHVTVSEAVGDLPDIVDDWRIDEMPYSVKKCQSGYQALLRNEGLTVRNNICRISNPLAKEMFKFLAPGQRYSDLSRKTRANLKFLSSFKSEIIKTRCRRLPLNEPSWTVIAHIGMDGYEYIHPNANRTLSVREAARLQSFPDWFVFCGNMRQQYVQVGNAVPPLLAYSIATKIKELVSG